jgi:NAD(P)-dependent dehydrogenase (short-subunit alcohol dehydrogenase family)
MWQRWNMRQRGMSRDPRYSIVSEVTASYGAQHAEPQPIDNVIQRMGTPDEVAEAVAFLASPHTSFMYGTPLIVDGGKLVRRVSLHTSIGQRVDFR